MIAGVLLTEVFLAGVLASGRVSIALWVFVAALCVAFAFRYPMLTAVATLVLGASVFYSELFAVSIGPLNANGPEVLLGALFVVAVTRPQRRGLGGIAGAGLLAFLVIVGISILLAVNEGTTEILNAFSWSRAYLTFVFFFVIVRLFSDRESLRRLLFWATMISAVTGFVAVYLSLLGGPESFFQDPSQQFIKSEEGLGIIQRVRLPGLSLAYALYWYAVVKTIRYHGRERLLWGLAVVGMSLNIVVSFNRNMWIGIVIGLPVLLALAGPQVRRRLAGTLAVAAFALVLIGAQPGPESKLSPLIARGTTLTNRGSLLAEASIQSRENETEIAWGVAKRNLLTGIGPGVQFGAEFFEATAQGVWVKVPQYFLHNQYLYILLIAGIPALLAFLVFLLASVRSAFARGTRTAESAAWGVGLVSIMLSAIVAIYFSDTDMIFAIALLAGASYSARRTLLEGSEENE